MPKPTLLQHILNRPSQSYTAAGPSSRRSLDKRNFHSVREELLKAASVHGANAQESRASADRKPISQLPLPEPIVSTILEAHSDDEDSTSDGDVFYTPNTSPRVSTYSEHEQRHLSLDSAKIAEGIYGTNVLKFIDVTTPLPKSSNANSASSDWLSPSYPHSHHRSASRSSSYSLASTSTAGVSSVQSGSTLLTSFSAPSTRATTPVESDSGKLDDIHLERSSIKTTRSPRKGGNKKSTSAPEDWAKDVRWLVPVAEIPARKKTASTSSQSSTRSRSNSEPDPMLQTVSPVPVPDRIKARPRRSNSAGSHSTSRRSVARRRMSAVWEEEEGDDPSTSSQPRRAQAADLAAHTTHSRSRAISAPHSTPPRARASSQHSGSSRKTVLSTSSSYTATSRTVDIPVPLPVSDGGSPSGFTSLVLPRAAYAPSSNKRYSVIFGGGDDSVDITRSGLSQTTMSTISITKNAASATYGARPRFLSLSSFTITTPGSETNLKVSANTPAHLLTSLPSPLSFTSHTSPPTKVNSHQVLVQVYAVAVDGLDDAIVCEKIPRTDCYGFIPGRSFVGRAVECGFEVSNVAKSDWVMGLLDVRKCGGLSEFIVVDKRRLTRSPRPSPELTLEQLALLPLCGIPAHRAVRTSQGIQRGTRALVLQGHDGAGALAVQELVAYGAYVTVQIPPGSSSDKEKDTETVRQLVDRVHRWGAHEVKVDSAVTAVNLMHESEFDLVIDTIGGRRIWDACRRVLHTTGQFTTLVGDSGQAVPSINAHFKSNLRSLRRAFVKKDHKAIGYAWVSPIADVDNDGEDIRDSLVAIGKLAVDGVLTPWVDAARCVPFERTPTLFTIGENTILKDGRTGVVRIVD